MSEIESLYYSKPVIDALANRQAETLGADAGELLAKATADSLKAIAGSGTPERLAAGLAAKTVARIVSSKHPTADELSNAAAGFNVKVENPYSTTLSELNGLLAAQDLDNGLVCGFPIRDTPMNSVVANALASKA